MRQALRRATVIAAALQERSEALRAGGFEPQVSDIQDLSVVFVQERGVKRRATVNEATALADAAEPAALLPNVLLRPVLERAVLPTVGYVAGPAELAYFAQVSAVAEALGVEPPLALPRWSGTVIEPHVGRTLGRLGLEPSDLRDPHRAEQQLARVAMPDAVASALERLRNAIDRQSTTLLADGDARSLVPDAAVEGAKRSLLARVQRLERRYLAAVKRREDELMRQVATVRAHLYPNGKRQERALNMVPMLSRHGSALLAAMRACAGAHAHAVIGGDVPQVRPSSPPMPADGATRP